MPIETNNPTGCLGCRHEADHPVLAVIAGDHRIAACRGVDIGADRRREQFADKFVVIGEASDGDAIAVGNADGAVGWALQFAQMLAQPIKAQADDHHCRLFGILRERLIEGHDSAARRCCGRVGANVEAATSDDVTDMRSRNRVLNRAGACVGRADHRTLCRHDAQRCVGRKIRPQLRELRTAGWVPSRTVAKCAMAKLS